MRSSGHGRTQKTPMRVSWCDSKSRSARSASACHASFAFAHHTLEEVKAGGAGIGSVLMHTEGPGRRAVGGLEEPIVLGCCPCSASYSGPFSAGKAHSQPDEVNHVQPCDLAALARHERHCTIRQRQGQNHLSDARAKRVVDQEDTRDQGVEVPYYVQHEREGSGCTCTVDFTKEQACSHAS